jgi:hypothetical protein
MAGKILYFGVLKRLLWLSFKIQGAQLGRTTCNVKGNLTDGIVLLIIRVDLEHPAIELKVSSLNMASILARLSDTNSSQRSDVPSPSVLHD